MRSTLLLALAALFVSVSPLRVSAQAGATAAAAVAADNVLEVYSVKFRYEKMNSSDNWLEAEVALDARPGGRQVSGEFLEQVKISLSLAYPSPNAKAETEGKIYYRSTVEAAAIESGRVIVRFYLPPEIVKRDRLRGDVAQYLVELEVAGQTQRMTLAKGSKDISDAASFTKFKSEVSAAAGQTEGILMPQYFTPFANDSRRQSPTLLRREMQR